MCIRDRVIVTLPLGDRYFFATSSTITSNMIIARKTPILDNINCNIVFYIFIPLKHINAIAINPTVMKVMPSPRRLRGTSV